MEYDPVKRNLGSLFKRSLFSLRVFYFALDQLFLRTWYVHKEIKRIVKTVGKNTEVSVLDAGSGFGQYVWYLARNFKQWKIKGIDVKEEEISECKELFKRAKIKNVIFEIQDITNYISKNNYDIILSVDVLEHIFEDVKVLKNFYGSLKNDGVLIISTPSDQGGSDIHNEGDESFISEHVRDGYSPKDISLKLKIAGFDKIETKYSYGKAGGISWKFSIKYPMKMLNVSKWLLLFLPIYYSLVFPFCYFLNVIDINLKNKKGTGLIVTATKSQAA